MAKTLLQFKTWSNSVVADDLHLVSLEGTVLKLTWGPEPDKVLAELDMAEEPPVVEEDPEAATAKVKEPSSKAPKAPEK